MQVQRARVFLVRTRPLDATELLEALPAHAGVHRAQGPELLPRFVRGDLAPAGAEPVGELGDDPDVVARAAGRIKGLAHPLHTSLAVGDGAVGLEGRVGGREHHVGELGGPGHEQILDDQAVQPGKQFLGVGLVGLARCRVLADDVGGREFLALHRLEHLGEGPAVLRDDRHAPGGLESRARLGVLFDVLEAGELVRDGAHVAAPLHVVLTAEGVHAAAVHPDVAGEQREIDQRQHVVHGVVVLGDAQRPTDHGAIGLGVGVRHLADDLARNARDLFTALEGPVHDRILVLRRTRASPLR